jgi:hypothetical protein
MTGYQSKKKAAQDKLNDDDDTQVYGDALTIAYQSGYYDGKNAAQPAQRPWVDLTEDQIKVIEEMALTKQWAIRMALASVKEKNS